MLIERLQKQSGLSLSQLQRIADTASKRYKVYRIPKRTGGERTIAHPSKELKAIQRWLNKTLFNKLEVHENATAYKKGSGIKANAHRHKNTLFTLRLDFRDFFPSFSSDRIKAFIANASEQVGIVLSEADISFICSVSTRNNQLTIGAPSSPKITNAMMLEFDSYVTTLAKERELIYTRYADDLFVSASQPDALEGVSEIIQKYAKGYQHVCLTINQAKTAYLSKRYRRSITGLIITPDHKVSIGRNRKKEIKSLINSYKYGQLDLEKRSYLQGLLAYTLDVEESFVTSLENKYGSEVINAILKRGEGA